MLVYDAHGIIIQHNYQDPTAAPDSASGGDSCARTGPLAASGSLIDVNNVPLFILPSKEIVRHPYQPGFNDARATSRDNVVQFFCSDLDSQRESALYYAQKGWVNKDFLAPDVRLYLYYVARVKPPLWLRLIGPIYLYMSILFMSYVQPEAEINQLACMCSVMDPKFAKALLYHHANIETNMALYWQGWRDQKQIGDAILGNLKRQAALD